MTIGVLTTAQKPRIRSRVRSLGAIGVRRCERWACGEATGKPLVCGPLHAHPLVAQVHRLHAQRAERQLVGREPAHLGTVGPQPRGSCGECVTGLRGLGLEPAQLGVDLVDAVGHEPRLGLRAGRHLRRGRPADGVAPRRPHRGAPS